MSTGTSSIENSCPARRISDQSLRPKAKWCSLPCGPSRKAMSCGRIPVDIQVVMWSGLSSTEVWTRSPL